MRTLSMPIWKHPQEAYQLSKELKPRVPWETLAVSKKRADKKKITSLSNKRNPANINAQKLKKAQNEQTNVYLKEKYIQNQINKIRNSVEDRSSRRAR